MKNWVWLFWIKLGTFSLNHTTFRLKGEFTIGEYLIYADVYGSIPSKFIKNTNINNYLQSEFDERNLSQVMKALHMLENKIESPSNLRIYTEKERLRYINTMREYIFILLDVETSFRVNDLKIKSKSDIRDDKIEKLLNFQQL